MHDMPSIQPTRRRIWITNAMHWRRAWRSTCVQAPGAKRQLPQRGVVNQRVSRAVLRSIRRRRRRRWLFCRPALLKRRTRTKLLSNHPGRGRPVPACRQACVHWWRAHTHTYSYITIHLLHGWNTSEHTDLGSHLWWCSCTLRRSDFI